MGLLAADLQALGNVLRGREGRRPLFGHLVTLTVLAGISSILGEAMLAQPSLRDAVLHARGGGVRTLLGAALGPSFLVAVWFGFGHAWRALFETPELPLWRQAPLPAWRPPLQVLLRILFLCWLWASALCTPFALRVLGLTSAPPAAVLMVPVAVLVCLLPTLAMVMAAQILMQRFLAGPAAQTLATVLAGLASLAFAGFLTASAFAPSSEQAAALATFVRQQPELPGAAGLGADLLAWTAGRELPARTAPALLGWLGLPLLLFLLVGLLHPRAAENSARVRAGRGRRRRPLADTVVAAVRQKELAQIAQQPGHLIGMALFAVLLWVFARNGVLVRPILTAPMLPLPARQCGAMLGLWFLAALMALNGNMGRVALQDGAQWSLYQLAPARPGAILRGKLEAIATLLLWPVLVVAFLGAQVFGAGLATVLVFLGMALLGNGIALGVLALVGTMPWLLRPDESGRLGQGARPLLAAMLLVLAFELALAPALVTALILADLLGQDAIPLGTAAALQAGALGASALLAAVAGGLVGARNFARLLRPR